MKNYILAICAGMLLITSCSDSITKDDQQLAETRMNDNCTVTPVDDDLFDGCEVFEDIYMEDELIHILFDVSLFSNLNECLNNTLIYDPNQTIKHTSPKCGARDYNPLYCITLDDAEFIIDLSNIDVTPAIYELCFVSECLELNALLEDCFNEVGSSNSSGTFCMELLIECN